MKLDQIIKGLEDLLEKNNYNPATIVFYKREWKKLEIFLLSVYGNTDFCIDKGLEYLEATYGFITKYDSGMLSQQRVQLLRVIHLLEDYQLHGVLTRRYTSSKNPIILNDTYSSIQKNFEYSFKKTELSNSTMTHYTGISNVFLDFLIQKEITELKMVNIILFHDFMKTFSGLSFKTIEQHICGMRYFFRYLLNNNLIDCDISKDIHMPKISKQAKIPSLWSKEELTSLLSTIDRNGPIGKRDYAMILLACILGIRSGDIKRLTFDNFNWENKKVSFIQHKTKKYLVLPLPDVVGWAIIDYIKNGRPSYYESNIVFIKHMPPFDPFADDNHLSSIIKKYMNKAGIKITKNHKVGFHSLRHSAASLMLESGTQLPVITEILGHSDVDITSVYLKTDIGKLKECILPLSFDDDIKFNI